MKRIARAVLDPFLSRLAARVAARVPAPAVAVPVTDHGTDTALAWNLKLHGSRLAREMFEQNLRPLIEAPDEGTAAVPLVSKLCEEADIESRWFVHWCRQLQIAPIYHRKVWEDCFALQAIWEAGLMREGARSIVFGAGEEPLPAYLAAQGVSVLATDLDPTDPAAAAWADTQQHANLDRLHKPWLLDREAFDSKVAFRPVDMNAIPDDLNGQFDFCWSLCSLEHVGSAALGLRFIERSLDCLRPGGLAVHTTEFNLTSETDTISDGPCVLFTRPQIEGLVERLRANGDEVLGVDFQPGTRPLDQFVDLPPFPRPSLEWISPNALTLPAAPHLRLALLGHVTTSIALIIRRRG